MSDPFRQRKGTLEKGLGADIVEQVQRINTQAEKVQAEFDALKDHLDAYLTASAPVPVKPVPTRHISHLTQMAAKALHRDVPGMHSIFTSASTSVRSRPAQKKDPRDKWDEMAVYESKNGSDAWMMQGGESSDGYKYQSEAKAALERVWGDPWTASQTAR